MGALIEREKVEQLADRVEAVPGSSKGTNSGTSIDEDGRVVDCASGSDAGLNENHFPIHKTAPNESGHPTRRLTTGLGLKSTTTTRTSDTDSVSTRVQVQIASSWDGQRCPMAAQTMQQLNPSLCSISEVRMKKDDLPIARLDRAKPHHGQDQGWLVNPEDQTVGGAVKDVRLLGEERRGDGSVRIKALYHEREPAVYDELVNGCRLKYWSRCGKLAEWFSLHGAVFDPIMDW